MDSIGICDQDTVIASLVVCVVGAPRRTDSIVSMKSLSPSFCDKTTPCRRLSVDKGLFVFTLLRYFVFCLLPSCFPLILFL